MKYGPTESPIPIWSRIVYQFTNIIIRDLEYSESTFSIAECWYQEEDSYFKNEDYGKLMHMQPWKIDVYMCETFFGSCV